MSPLNRPFGDNLSVLRDDTLASETVDPVYLDPPFKSAGSLYLHCDPRASDYLKMLLDAVFGPTNLRSEITWKTG